MFVLSYRFIKCYIVDMKIFLFVLKRFIFFIFNVLIIYDIFDGKNFCICLVSFEVLVIFILFWSYWILMVLLCFLLVIICVFRFIVFFWCVVMLVVLRIIIVKFIE